MSKWHKFDVYQFELADAGFELRDLYKQTYRWLKTEAKGKWKITRVRNTGGTISIRPFLKFEPMSRDRLVVSLKKQRDVSLFKLYFSDHYHPVVRDIKREIDPVLLPIIRKTVPQLLAQAIISVQPMSGIGVTKSYVDQTLSNNATFRGPSPSQQRALRKRLKKKGWVFGSIRLKLRGV